jgi:hypothetical protein
MNIRYKYCPQLKVYDEIGYRWLPSLMFMNRPNYRSKICNTDIHGLRFNSKNYIFSENSSIFDLKTDKNKSIMVGSSTTFGVGSTSDEKTIPGILSDKKNHVYNFGGRAFNGFQEIILTEMMINKLKNIKHIILYSGMNDIYMNYNDRFLISDPGPFYYSKTFLKNIEYSDLSFNRKILKLIFPNLDIDYRNITKSELFRYLINFKNKKNKDDYFPFPKINLDDIVSRNIKIWKYLSKSMSSKITFFVPPFMPWCKDLSCYTIEEKEITRFINNSSENRNASDFDNIESDYEKIIDLLSETCKKNGIDFFDCNQVFRQGQNKNKWLFVDKAHLTDYGNEIISEFILNKL